MGVKPVSFAAGSGSLGVVGKVGVDGAVVDSAVGVKICTGVVAAPGTVSINGVVGRDEADVVNGSVAMTGEDVANVDVAGVTGVVMVLPGVVGVELRSRSSKGREEDLVRSDRSIRSRS